MPRPDYSLSKLGGPPSGLSSDRLSSDAYRCRRLLGLLNLYHWSLEYCVHGKSYWTLGQGAYSYRLMEGDLWLLGIETVADLRYTCWPETAESVGAQCRADKQARGRFNPRTLNTDRSGLEDHQPIDEEEWKGRYGAKSRSRRGPDKTRLRFDGRDLVKSVTFYTPDLDVNGRVDWMARIPWLELASSLRQASNHAEVFVKKCVPEWKSPPFFVNQENGRKVLSYFKSEGIDDEKALIRLEQHRLDCTEQIRFALRETFEANGGGDERVREVGYKYSPSMLQSQLGISAPTLRKYAQAAGVVVPPGKGKRDHRYSAEDRRMIIRQIINGAVDSALVDKCQALIAAEIKSKSTNEK